MLYFRIGDKMNKIVLASSSPRRKELLKKYNVNSFVYPEIEEKTSSKERPEEIVMALSFQKASQVASKFKGEEIVVGADTIVVYNGRILGKPKDEVEAFKTIELLNDKEHQVVTGISIIKANSNIKIIDYERTIVKFRKLTNKKIQKYIDTKEYIDKAGGYGIQGYGELLVEYIKGCYYNVVGFPIGKFDFLLEKHFNMTLL